MAEICVDCWNELNGTNYPESKYVLTDEEYLCEGCAEYKKVIIIERSPSGQFLYLIWQLIKNIFTKLKKP